MTDVAISANAPGSLSIQGLVAAGPAADCADKLMLFGQFVGDWEADFTVYGTDGSKQTEKAEWHFGWVLGGRAVQDVFIVPRRSERGKTSAVASDYGTVLRIYDPNIDAWRVVWASPVTGDLFTFIARPVGEEIVLEGHDPDGSPMRWIFSQITPDAFHWRRVFSADGGKTWQLHKEMSVRRVGLAS
ncbi:MAG TPA: hypothetical protein VKA60_23645 [Blastocatellia bacterium]|nr:hypothetical protein [Blastocatellia bacterium]